MKSGKRIHILYLGIAIIFMLFGLSCQRSPMEPDDAMIEHLQALSDSSGLEKENTKANYHLTTDSLDAIRGHSLEGTSSSKSVNIPPMLGYGLVALIIIGFALVFYFVVIKRVKDGISDMSYQIKHAKDKIEETIAQQSPEEIKREEKEKINELLDQLNQFDMDPLKNKSKNE